MSANCANAPIHSNKHLPRCLPTTLPMGRIQGAVGAIATPKTYDSNFVHHDSVQLGK